MNKETIGGPVYNSKIYIAGYDRAKSDFAEEIKMLKQKLEAAVKVIEAVRAYREMPFSTDQFPYHEKMSDSLDVYDKLK